MTTVTTVTIQVETLSPMALYKLAEIYSIRANEYHSLAGAVPEGYDRELDRLGNEMLRTSSALFKMVEEKVSRVRASQLG